MTGNLQKQTGQLLRMRRKARGLTLVQLEELSGVDRGYLSDAENGKQNISLAMLERICVAMGVEVGIEMR